MIDIDTGLPVENKYDEPPNHGRVLIDGIDISKVELRKVRSSIAIIPQDPTYILFIFIFIYIFILFYN
jgi:ABC-type transport system involved in Fe-S cluster assembly fused permease/ATPase subunit